MDKQLMNILRKKLNEDNIDFVNNPNLTDNDKRALLKDTITITKLREICDKLNLELEVSIK